MLFTDLHGHSINDNIFMYGNKGNTFEDSEEIKDIPNLINQDLLSKIREKINRNKRALLNWDNWLQGKWNAHSNVPNEIRLFTIGEWKFSIDKSKENTGRVCVFREFGIKHCYTLESSYFRAIHEDSKHCDLGNVPISSSIKYNGNLISNDTIIIDDENLIEFGKYFAHVITYFYNQKL